MSKDFQSFRQALPFVQAFRGKIFVIKVGGEVCASSESLVNFAQQVAVLQSLGLRLVLVHGGGAQGTELAKRLGIETSFVSGKRITSPAMLEVQKMAIRGKVNTDLVSVLVAHGVKAVGLSGVDGKMVVAKKRSVAVVNGKEVDFGEVGDVVSVNPEALVALMSNGFVPLVASLSVSDSGDIYNTNADTIATQLAISMKAYRLIFVTGVDGVMLDINDPSSLLAEIMMDQVEDLVERGVIQGGMIPKIENCALAVRHGIQRAHIINGHVSDSLLEELFTNEGCGTWVLKPGTPYP